MVDVAPQDGWLTSENVGAFMTSYWYVVLIGAILLLGGVECVRTSLQAWRDRHRIRCFQKQCLARRVLRAAAAQDPSAAAAAAHGSAAAAEARAPGSPRSPYTAVSGAATPAPKSLGVSPLAPPSPEVSAFLAQSRSGAEEGGVSGLSFSSSGGSDGEGAAERLRVPTPCPRYPDSVRRVINKQRQENAEAWQEARRALEIAQNKSSSDFAS